MKHWPILIIFGKQYPKNWRKSLLFRRPYLIPVSALPCEMRKS